VHLAGFTTEVSYVGVAFYHAGRTDGRTDGLADGETDMARLLATA
jgi:hypothetical protein